MKSTSPGKGMSWRLQKGGDKEREKKVRRGKRSAGRQQAGVLPRRRLAAAAAAARCPALRPKQRQS